MLELVERKFNLWKIHCSMNFLNLRVRISARVQESTLAKTPANESTRVQLDSRKLSDVSHKLNTGESEDSLQTPPRRIQMDSHSSLRNSTPKSAQILQMKIATGQRSRLEQSCTHSAPADCWFSTRHRWTWNVLYQDGWFKSLWFKSIDFS